MRCSGFHIIFKTVTSRLHVRLLCWSSGGGSLSRMAPPGGFGVKTRRIVQALGLGARAMLATCPPRLTRRDRRHRQHRRPCRDRVVRTTGILTVTVHLTRIRPGQV